MAETVKISFYAKNKIICPVCDKEFYRENLLTGGGRMNAGDLTKELHRLYEPTQKYGKVFPLIYSVTVCPACYTAAFEKDFIEMTTPTAVKLEKMKADRINSIIKLFPDLDFSRQRTLTEGIASYILAMISYDSFPVEQVPTFKQAMASIRASWLCNSMNKDHKGENYDYLSRIFYRKSAFFYRQIVENEQSGKESIENVANFGPDIDNNYGFDGVIYLAGYLEYVYGQKGDLAERLARLRQSLTVISRIVGMRKSSKSKPSTLVENAIELHGEIKKEIKNLEGNA